MTRATTVRIKVEVLPPEKVVLELSPRDAALLKNVLGSPIGGGKYRSATDRIFDALDDAGVPDLRGENGLVTSAFTQIVSLALGDDLVFPKGWEN